MLYAWPLSVSLQNIQMYIWGVFFNALGAWIKDGENIMIRGLLSGYTPSAWAVVVCNALNGLAISAVLKYADNIARVYAHALAMMATMAVRAQPRLRLSRRSQTRATYTPSSSSFAVSARPHRLFAWSAVMTCDDV